MQTLGELKNALRRAIQTSTISGTQDLSEEQYVAGFDNLLQGPGIKTYEEFILPKLTQALERLLESRETLSVLEVGPGTKSVLGDLPIFFRRRIKNYTAFEKNATYATRLKTCFDTHHKKRDMPFPCLEFPPRIVQDSFELQESEGITGIDYHEKYDLILFCHSLYGIKDKQKLIKETLKLLVTQPGDSVVMIFHRDRTLQFHDLVCQQTAFFPTGVVRVANQNDALDVFARFIAGCTMRDENEDFRIREKWRQECRSVGRWNVSEPEHLFKYLFFSEPDVMIVFNQYAIKLSELTERVPRSIEGRVIKNYEARLHTPAAIVRPTKTEHVQECVRWALRYGTGLTVLGGSHSGHCLQSGIVAVDMEAFNKITIHENNEVSPTDSRNLIAVEAGCKSEDVARHAQESGVMIPLGSRPSVGAGLWLQGGIGHQTRSRGLTCDSIVGAVLVSVKSGHVLCVGCVPPSIWPHGGIRPDGEDELLWAIKGAGTNFGIVIRVVFESYPAQEYQIRKWDIPVRHVGEAQQELSYFDRLMSGKSLRNFSGDMFLYNKDNNEMHLGIMTSDASANNGETTPTHLHMNERWGGAEISQIMDGFEVFESQMYISGIMHGGHGGGRTSSFKRCVFLKDIQDIEIAARLVSVGVKRPTPFCYLHLLHGGGAIRDVAKEATAFGCRDWNFACVITGVWERDKEENGTSNSVVRWVYDVLQCLLPLSNGVYSADLGPDPRDATLATMAFGPNYPRLVQLKRKHDPKNVLAYACPLKHPSSPRARPKLIVIVTGEHGHGKDHSADTWVSTLNKAPHTKLKVRMESISERTKRKYAAATGADGDRLIQDHAYKEEHRSGLNEFFRKQLEEDPDLWEDHFMEIVHRASDLDVLFITGMREKAPITRYSPLIPESRMIEVYVHATSEAQWHTEIYDDSDNYHKAPGNVLSIFPSLGYAPTFIFENETPGRRSAELFAENRLLPLISDDLERLKEMVRTVPDTPVKGIDFRHVLGIAEQPGGLALCTSLLKQHFVGDWNNIDALVCCELGGIVFATPMAYDMNKPLALIRKGGKLPPPTESVTKPLSNISGLSGTTSIGENLEIESNVMPRGSSVMIVDDVLATGKTLCAVLQLLDKVGIVADNVNVMVVAEFPLLAGRDFLRKSGFGKVPIRSLLVFGGR